MHKTFTSRATVLLVHGMGGRPAWWNPLLPALKRVDLIPKPLRLPKLENVGPEGWRAAVLAEMGNEPVILIGHSLGAAICMDVARTHPVARLVLLACPPFLPDFTPQPPPDTGISAAALRRIARFLRNACANASQVSATSVHFVGELDRWAPCEQARRLPFPLVVIPGAGHGLNRSTLLARRLAEFLV